MLEGGGRDPQHQPETLYHPLRTAAFAASFSNINQHHTLIIQIIYFYPQLINFFLITEGLTFYSADTTTERVWEA